MTSGYDERRRQPFRRLYPDEPIGWWGMPLVIGDAWVEPARVVEYTAADWPDDAAIHFFVDDYRLERCWSRLEQVTERLRGRVVFGPDFSLYRDMPIAVQAWQVYRARFCEAFWEERDVKVVPCLMWGAPDSYAFAFDGIERGATCTVSTVGLDRANDPDTYELFRQGFAAAVRATNPTRVLVYGDKALPSGCEELVPVRYYPTRYREMRERIAAGAAGSQLKLVR